MYVIAQAKYNGDLSPQGLCVNDTIRMYKKRNLEMYKIVHENPQKVHSYSIINNKKDMIVKILNLLEKVYYKKCLQNYITN